MHIQTLRILLLCRIYTLRNVDVEGAGQSREDSLKMTLYGGEGLNFSFSSWPFADRKSVV